MSQAIVSTDLYWIELEKQLREKSVKTHQKANNINRLIEEVVKDYKNVKDSGKSFQLIKKLEKALEILFDTLNPDDINEKDQEVLTEICRKFNEDLHLQELREFADQNNLIFEGCYDTPTTIKHKAQNYTSDNNAFGTPRKANHSIPVEAKVLEETYFLIHDDFGSHNVEINQQEIHIQALLEKDEKAELVKHVKETVSKQEQVAVNKPHEEEIVEKKVLEEILKPEEILLNKQKGELSKLIAQMKEEFKENRIDGAHMFYNKVLRYKDENNLKGEALNFYNFSIQESQKDIDDVKRVHEECQLIWNELEDEQGYSVESIKKGFTIKYKAPPGELVSLKMEGEVDIPLFNMVSLIYEMEGYTEWMPFCKTVKELRKVSRTAKAGYLKYAIPPPLSDREAYIYGAGFDRLKVNGSVFVAAQSIHDKAELCEKYEVEVPPQGRATRLDIQYMGASLYPLSKNKIRFSIIAKFDIKLKFLPVSIINWFARKAASFLIEKILKKANNLEGTMWERKIKEDREFYGWFEQKLNAFLAEQESKNSTNQH